MTCAPGDLQEKAAYKEAFARLRELKQEIEHLQMLLEQSRTKLQRDFEHWMTLMLRQQQAASAVTAAGLTEGSAHARSLPRYIKGCSVHCAGCVVTCVEPPSFAQRCDR